MELPPLDPKTGFFPTLNRMGGMSPTLDRYSGAFVEFAAAAPGMVLDVGAAYGVASLAALDRGARVLAMDLEARHLELLEGRAPEAHRSRLTVRAGRFPEDLELSEGCLGAALLARMLHFLDGVSIDAGFRKLGRWMAPGGKVFGLAVTPFLQKLVSFMPTYEERRVRGERWPGLIEDVSVFDPEGAAGLPAMMNFLDPEVLERTFRESGFEVEEMQLFSRPEHVGEMRLDGRELVGFVARRRGDE